MADKTCAEGYVVRAQSNDNIVYPEVSSCLTLTCVLKNGGMIGAHASHYKKGTYTYDQILGAVKKELGSDKVSVAKVWVLGDLHSWKDDFTPGNDKTDKTRILDTDNGSALKKLEKHIRITL